ncbi:MAG: hypothetical protein Q9184_002760 [Pyrenodesmia sp. 2 TL-2023]
MSQISYRFPGLKLFEVGAGTSAKISAVLREKERFAQKAIRIVFKIFDMEKQPAVKPSGFLIVGGLTSTDLLFTSMTVGTLPGWWIGAESGRPWEPLLNLQQWDSQLRKAAFAGIDTVTPDISAALPMNFFVTQAADDQITLLRNPLVVKERPAGVRTNGLAIIGGTTPLVRILGQETAQVLSHRFQNKQFFDSIKDFTTSNMARLRAADGLSPFSP